MKCSECTAQFTQRKNLYAHLRKFHNIEPVFTKKSDARFRCNICSKLFSYKSTLAKHKRLQHKEIGLEEHQIRPRTSRLLCPQEECDGRFALYASLRHHLLCEHSVVVEEENLEFDSLESFETWKSTIQQQHLSLYTRDSSPKVLARVPFGDTRVQKLYYNCHRSHFFRPGGTGVRCLKFRGSNKIGKACPSRIVVSVLESEERSLLVKVKFWKTHCGHETDLSRISLNSETRADIAERLQNGESFDQILNSIRNADLSHKDINPRLSLITRKDLHNIVRDFNIEHSKIRCRNNEVQGDNLWDKERTVLDECPEFDFEEHDEEDTGSINNGSDAIEADIKDLIKSPRIITIFEGSFHENVVRKVELILALLNKNITTSESTYKIMEKNLDNIISILNEKDAVKVETIRIVNVQQED